MEVWWCGVMGILCSVGFLEIVLNHGVLLEIIIYKRYEES